MKGERLICINFILTSSGHRDSKSQLLLWTNQTEVLLRYYVWNDNSSVQLLFLPETTGGKWKSTTLVNDYLKLIVFVFFD